CLSGGANLRAKQLDSIPGETVLRADNHVGKSLPKLPDKLNSRNIDNSLARTGFATVLVIRRNLLLRHCLVSSRALPITEGLGTYQTYSHEESKTKKTWKQPVKMDIRLPNLFRDGRRNRCLIAYVLMFMSREDSTDGASMLHYELCRSLE
ncbi:hypothetical protein ARMGADRAFT_1015512, partial [Armillaria gallica]